MAGEFVGCNVLAPYNGYLISENGLKRVAKRLLKLWNPSEAGGLFIISQTISDITGWEIGVSQGYLLRLMPPV